MSSVTQIKGMERLLAELRRRKDDASDFSKAGASVGYAMDYAVHVHETNKNYNNNKKWHYLSDPTAQLADSGELGRIITRAYTGGAKIQQALILAALRIQRESQLVVPVDTGALKSSAFVGPTSQETSLASAGRQRGRTILAAKKPHRDS